MAHLPSLRSAAEAPLFSYGFRPFFLGASLFAADLVVGEPGQGWAVAMGTLGFERGVSTIGQQTGFRRELDAVLDL